MDKRIRFVTKEEFNARREREFMALSPGERFQWFLRSFDGRVSEVPSANERRGNYIIRKKDAHR